MQDARLIGTWRLVSYEQHGNDGLVQHPLGHAPSGMLIYTSHVMLSSWPNREGTDLVRFLAFERHRLLLRSAPFMVQGIEQVAYLVWERDGGSAE